MNPLPLDAAGPAFTAWATGSALQPERSDSAALPGGQAVPQVWEQQLLVPTVTVLLAGAPQRRGKTAGSWWWWWRWLECAAARTLIGQCCYVFTPIVLLHRLHHRRPSYLAKPPCSNSSIKSPLLL